MFKRFVIGFILGIGLMYWYIHESGRYIGGAHSWVEESASGYRGDRDHEAVERETGN
ncbi:MAG TPA: hypothetical protein VLF14_08885 [Candidatus Binatia bacterium]|nr:hypothetical protein [Candidatus Binatia bacterium]